MSAERIHELIDQMDPHEALSVLADKTRQLLSLLGQEATFQFVMKAVGDTHNDKVASLVNL